MPNPKIIEVDVSLIFNRQSNEWQVSIADDHVLVEAIPGIETNTVAGIVLHLNKDPNRTFRIGFAVDEVDTKPSPAIDLGQLNLLSGNG